MGCTEDGVESLRPCSELGSVRFADEDSSGSAHARHEQVVLGGNMVLEERRAVGGANACGIDEVFVGDRQAVQRTQRLAMRLHLIGARCRCGCLVRNERDNGVHPGIDAIDLLEVLLKRFAGRKLLGADHGGHLNRRREAERGRRLLGAHRSGKNGGGRDCGQAREKLTACAVVLLW